ELSETASQISPTVPTSSVASPLIPNEITTKIETLISLEEEIQTLDEQTKEQITILQEELKKAREDEARMKTKITKSPPKEEITNANNKIAELKAELQLNQRELDRYEKSQSSSSTVEEINRKDQAIREKANEITRLGACVESLERTTSDQNTKINGLKNKLADQEEEKANLLSSNNQLRLAIFLSGSLLVAGIVYYFFFGKKTPEPEKENPLEVSQVEGKIFAQGPQGENELVLNAESNNLALAGTFNSLIFGLIAGVSKGYRATLEVKGLATEL
ncbi:28015_t:CDS:2, partial [Racocetra persica]